MSDHSPDSPAFLIQNFAARRSLALVLDAGARGVYLGSAICIRIGERRLLATAAHNVADLEDHEVRIVPPGVRDGAIPFVERSCRKDRPAPVDVAWIEIEPRFERLYDLAFLDLSHLGSERRQSADRPYFIHGYPAAAALPRGGREDRVGPLAMGFFTVAVDPAERSAARRGGLLAGAPGHELAIDYRERHGHPVPRGLSGGGIWRLPSARGGGRAALVAITRTWSRRTRTLYGTRIEHWLELVHRDFPELRSEIERRLAPVARAAGSPPPFPALDPWDPRAADSRTAPRRTNHRRG